jgi:chromosome segregation ATPase
MALTPEEIRHVSIKRRARGYDRRETERLLTEIAESYESVWNQRADLFNDLKRLQADLEDAQQRERLRSAEQTDLHARLEQDEVELAKLYKETERLETDRGVQRAEIRRAHAELDGLRGDIERLKAEGNLEREEKQRANDELRHLREEVARLNADRGRLGEQSQRSSAEVAELREEVARLNADRGQLTEESHRSTAEVAQLREEVKRLNAERGQLDDQSQRSTAEVTELQEEVARLEAERGRVLQESARTRAELVELRHTEDGRDAELADLRRDVIELLRLLEGETNAHYRDLLTSAREPRESENDAKPRSDTELLSDLQGDAQRFETERAQFGDHLQEVEEELGVRDQVARRLWDLLMEHLRLLEGEPRRTGHPDSSPATAAQPKSENETKPGTAQREPEGEGQAARPAAAPVPHAAKSAGDPLDRGALGL